MSLHNSLYVMFLDDIYDVTNFNDASLNDAISYLCIKNRSRGSRLYSLRFHISCRLGQQHDHQKYNLTNSFC
jgi:hypothetical protein